MSAIERKLSVGPMEIKSAEQGTARVRFALPDGRTPDKDLDITLPSAIPEGVQVIVSPFGHTSLTDGTLPAGRATVHANGTADVQFFMDTTAGIETFRTIKGLGQIAQYSYGFQVRRTGELTTAMRAVGAKRVIADTLPLELSCVVLAAGEQTGTIAIKSAPTQADIAEIARQVKQREWDFAPTWRKERLLLERLTEKCSPSEPVPSYRRKIAEKALAFVCAKWGMSYLQPIAVKFAVLPPGIGGEFRPEEPTSIFISTALPDDQILRIVAHECGGHLRDFAKGYITSEESAETVERLTLEAWNDHINNSENRYARQ